MAAARLHQKSAVVHIDAWAPTPGMVGDRYVDWPSQVGTDAIERAGAAMAEGGGWATGKDRSQPEAMAGEVGAPDGVDARMDLVEPACPQAIFDYSSAEAE
ncbi:MAG: hypothetical protein QOG62_2104 [Thermoleophilaceae bacterium]|jgi:hypothetical protein|nr:hypothetical protein [Thermoleophilaceae bacterium]